MIADPKYNEAAEIIRGLVTIPGGIELNVVAKKFPRRGPAECGSGYEQQEHTYLPGRLPDRLPVAPGMDEFVITLQGVLSASESPVTLMAQVDALLGNLRASTYWDSRTYFRNPPGASPIYQVTVFSDAYAAVPSA
jgi:hypothetical protein